MNKTDKPAEEKKSAPEIEPNKSSSEDLQLIPQFIAGLAEKIRDSVFYQDDSHVVYPVGHNVCIYNTEERTQVMIPGLDGSERITALAMSRSKRFLAIAEQTDKCPVISVFDMAQMRSIQPGQKPKVKKLFASNEIKNKAFTSIAFSQTSGEKMLVTLTDGDPDQGVYVWQWDRAKCMCMQTMQHPLGDNIGTQVSFSNTDHNIVLVTGTNTYWYFRVTDNTVLRAIHTSLKKEAHVSNNYTCHLWLPEGRLLVGTDQGEIMLCEQTGEYKMLLPESPGEGFNIMCMKTFSKGFICGGDQGQLMVFEKYNEPKVLYTGTKLPLQSGQSASTTEEQKRNQQFLMKSMLQSKITCMDLSSSEDTIILTTDNQQLIKVSANLERLSEPDFLHYDFLVCPFHSRQISGLDICIKKNLVATCSLDKTIKIWQFSQTNGFTLEINHEEEHQAYALAFHPSGFHIVVGFNSHISLMNVFNGSLHKYKQLEVKQCKEIQFSNGGHLFACQSLSSVLVYKFYTWDRPKDWEFKKHSGFIRSICWLEDDSGFVSAGMDENVCLWNLNTQGLTADDKKSNPDWQLQFGQPFQEKSSTDFTHVQVTKMDSDKYPIIYACGADRVIREIEPRTVGTELQLQVKVKYEEHVNLSKLAFTNNRKYFFAGKIEKDQPGSIQVLRYPFQKCFEIQAHAKAVERLRLSYDNKTLFTCSLDGTIACFSVVDKQGKSYESGAAQIVASQENLLPRPELEKKKARIDSLNASIEQEKKNKQFEFEQQKLKKNKQIDEQRDVMTSKKKENEEKLEDLEAATTESISGYANMLQQMKEKHVTDMARLNDDQQEKIEADHARQIELQAEMKDQVTKFEQCSAQLYLTQDQQMKTMEKEHKIEHDELEAAKERLSRQIEQMVSQFRETREHVENETWDKIDKQKEDDKREMATEIDRSMKQKGELTLIMNNFKDLRTVRNEQLDTISHMQNQLNDELAQIHKCQQQIDSQDKEIQERDCTLREKGQRINDLRQKTQELEKFKFVLDYKIKEMKQDIMPRETDAQKLHEQNTKMHQEVRHFDRVSSNLKLIKKDLRMRLDGLTKESKDIRNRIMEQDDYVKSFKDDIFECLQKITDYKKLKKSVVALHKVYVMEEKSGKTNDDSNHQQAFISIRSYLEKNLEHLRQNLRKDKKTQKTENARIMKENVVLLEQINDLQKRLHRQELDMRTEMQRKRELKRLKDNAIAGIEDENHDNQPTNEDMVAIQKDLSTMDNELLRMREEEQKWLDHLKKLQYASEMRRQQKEAAMIQAQSQEQVQQQEEQPQQKEALQEEAKEQEVPVTVEEQKQEEPVPETAEALEEIQPPNSGDKVAEEQTN